MNESLHGNLRRNSVRHDEGMVDVGGVLFVEIFAGCLGTEPARVSSHHFTLTDPHQI